MASHYRQMQVSTVAGHGAAAFDSASRAVLTLHMHNKAGVKMTMPTGSVRVGDVIRLSVGLGPFRVHGSCDVTEVLDEPRRRGFTYHTRPDHPEEGEESFFVDWVADDSVVVRLHSNSRPRRWFVRLGGPVSRLAQALINRRYLRMVRKIVAAEVAAH